MGHDDHFLIEWSYFLLGFPSEEEMTPHISQAAKFKLLLIPAHYLATSPQRATYVNTLVLLVPFLLKAAMTIFTFFVV